jgi:hypothetical protein
MMRRLARRRRIVKIEKVGMDWFGIEMIISRLSSLWLRCSVLTLFLNLSFSFGNGFCRGRRTFSLPRALLVCFRPVMNPCEQERKKEEKEEKKTCRQ